MEPSEAPVRQVISVLESLGLRYHVGGSLASSLHGAPRQTQDLDIVVDLPLSLVEALARRLESEFYLDRERLSLAVRTGRACNLIHLATGFKVDLFPLGSSPFDRSEFERASRVEGALGWPGSVAFKSAEDTVLRKLLWYRLGGETSERQWGDVLGVLQAQRAHLDIAYLERWAKELQVFDLLERAL